MTPSETGRYQVHLLAPGSDGDTHVVDLRDLADTTLEALRFEAAVAGDEAMVSLINETLTVRPC